MRILNIALFLLLGACSVAANKAPEIGKAPETGKEPVVENFGGDINSPNGQAWLATVDSGPLWGVQNPRGVNNWEENTSPKFLNPRTGDITNFHKERVDSVFLGAPSPTTAFYKSLRYDEAFVPSGFVEERVFGVFISNVNDQGTPKTFIYPATLRLTKAETDAIKVQVGIPVGDDVETGTAEQQKRYNAIVHVPSNYDLGRTPTITESGVVTSRPLAIIEKP